MILRWHKLIPIKCRYDHVGVIINSRAVMVGFLLTGACTVINMAE
jgi:hypothetical protein